MDIFFLQEEDCEDIIEVIIMLTSDEYPGDSQSAKEDLIEMLESEPRVQHLMKWLECKLSVKVSQLREYFKPKETGEKKAQGSKYLYDKNKESYPAKENESS